MKSYTLSTRKQSNANKIFQGKIGYVYSIKEDIFLTVLKFLTCLIASLLLCYSPVKAQNNNTNSNIIMYDFSKAPKEFQDLKIPDFLAFVTENKELSSENFFGTSFYPAEISFAFLYMGEYAKYATKEAEYLKLLEQNGFEYRTAWEGYTHYQKQWNNYYVLVTTGISYYEDDKESFLISIALTKEEISFPF